MCQCLFASLYRAVHVRSRSDLNQQIFAVAEREDSTYIKSRWHDIQANVKLRSFLLLAFEKLRKALSQKSFMARLCYTEICYIYHAIHVYQVIISIHYEGCMGSVWFSRSIFIIHIH